MKKTKAMLENEVKQLTKEVKSLNNLVDKLRLKNTTELHRQGGEFVYLYTATQLEPQYMSDLIDRTSLVRMSTIHNHTCTTDVLVREFRDGNRVIITQRRLKSEHGSLTSVMFFRRTKEE